MPASQPPPSTTSATPRRMASAASPMPWLPAAHAVITVEVYPLRPKSRLTFAAAMFGSIIGMKNGLTRMPPRLTSVREFASVSGKPPLPLPITTPMRSSSSADRLRPASSMASAAAATAVCEKRAMRLVSRRSMYLPGSKSGISPATLQGKSVGSARVMGPMPDLPLMRHAQYSSMESPSGVTAPMPVITTRLLPLFITILLET